MLGLMIGGQRHPWMVLRDCFARPVKSVDLSAFDVHLDEVDAFELELSYEFIDGSQRKLLVGGVCIGLILFLVDDKAVGGGVVRVLVQNEHIVLVPDALRINDDAALLNFGSEIALENFDVLRRGFDGDDDAGAGFQGSASVDADVRTAVEHNVAFLDVDGTGGVEANLLFRDVEGESELAVLAGWNPVGTVRGFPLNIWWFFRDLFTGGENAVLGGDDPLGMGRGVYGSFHGAPLTKAKSGNSGEAGWFVQADENEEHQQKKGKLTNHFTKDSTRRCQGHARRT